MSSCPICSGTGQLSDVDQRIPDDVKLRMDPELRSFMEQTDLRSEEERMMQYLHPRLFNPDCAFDMIRSCSFHNNALPFCAKKKDATEENEEQHAPAGDSRPPPVEANPPRTGGDVMRERREAVRAHPEEIKEWKQRSRPDRFAAQNNLKEAAKGLGL